VITIFGIPNCDKCRATRQWFSNHGISHQFHDVRKDGLSLKLAEEWLEKLGQQTLINKRSRTWRELAASLPAEPDDAAMARLIVENPTLVKRPLVDARDELLVGYDESQWQQFAD
jgi:Spx/MgsR family transcriptional regulator